MDSKARLIEVADPSDPVGIVLVLHGGAGRGMRPVSPAQLSVVRMVPIARSIAKAGRGRLAVYRLLNSTRGWNDDHTPVDDAWWALDEIARRRGEKLPAVLVGHSLGGRAAIFASGREEVVGAVGLAPWFTAADDPRGTAGKRVLIVHGDHDRIASIQRAASVARRIGMRADVEFVVVEGGKHAMLRHGREFVDPATDFALRTLGVPLGGSA